MPDRAVVNLAVESEGATREQAYSSAASLAARVDAVLGSGRPALGRVTTAQLVVQPQEHWDSGELVRTGWRAMRATVVEVTVLEALGGLLADLAQAGASVRGFAWELDPANPAHSEARRLAAEDARRRAFDYAGALGLEVGAVAWVSEPGLRQAAGHERAVGFAAAAARGPGAANEGQVVGVAPGELAAQAVVEVAFWVVGPEEQGPAAVQGP